MLSAEVIRANYKSSSRESFGLKQFKRETKLPWVHTELKGDLVKSKWVEQEYVKWVFTESWVI